MKCSRTTSSLHRAWMAAINSQKRRWYPQLSGLRPTPAGVSHDIVASSCFKISSGRTSQGRQWRWIGDTGAESILCRCL